MAREHRMEKVTDKATTRVFLFGLDDVDAAMVVEEYAIVVVPVSLAI